VAFYLYKSWCVARLSVKTEIYSRSALFKLCNNDVRFFQRFRAGFYLLLTIATITTTTPTTTTTVATIAKKL